MKAGAGNGGGVHDDWCEDPSDEPNRNGYASCDCRARLRMRSAAAERFMGEHQEVLTQLRNQIEQLKQELQQVKAEFRDGGDNRPRSDA